MEIINITEEQKDKLCNELARLTFEARKDKSVKCIYFAPYKGLGDLDGNVLEVTLVRDSCCLDEEEKFREYNKKHQTHDAVREYGLKILLDSDKASKYTVTDSNPSEYERSNNLMNSVILYDESGLFTKIKEQTTAVINAHGSEIAGVYFPYANLATIYPELDEALDKAMDIKRMERDTEAVKDFTRSRLFEGLKEIK